MGFPDGSDGNEFVCNAGDLCLISGSEDPLEEEMATHSSIVAWRIPWIEGHHPRGCKESDMTEHTHTPHTEPFAVGSAERQSLLS